MARLILFNELLDFLGKRRVPFTSLIGGDLQSDGQEVFVVPASVALEQRLNLVSGRHVSN